MPRWGELRYTYHSGATSWGTEDTPTYQHTAGNHLGISSLFKLSSVPVEAHSLLILGQGWPLQGILGDSGSCMATCSWCLPLRPACQFNLTVWSNAFHVDCRASPREVLVTMNNILKDPAPDLLLTDLGTWFRVSKNANYPAELWSKHTRLNYSGHISQSCPCAPVRPAEVGCLHTWHFLSQLPFASVLFLTLTCFKCLWFLMAEGQIFLLASTFWEVDILTQLEQRQT